MIYSSRTFFRTLVLVLCLVMFTTSVFAANKDFTGKNTYTLTGTGGFTLTPVGPRSQIEYVEVTLQHISEDGPGHHASEPKFSEHHNVDGSTLSWLHPRVGNTYQFRYEQDITTDQPYATVARQVPFPYHDIPDDVAQYTLPTAKIDSDNELIKELAFELSAGHTEAFALTSHVAHWVSTHIAYNLSTLTEAVSQPASWVLDNRVGVCDEISSLYIALLRSLGIPARFVFGLSYSSIDGASEDWGPHGWVEVYFPEWGWVAFDPTYNQYGWIDGSHIRLGSTADPDDMHVNYRWSAYGVDLSTLPLDFTVTHKQNNPGNPRITASLSLASPQIGFGSHNKITVTVTNRRPYYVAALLRLQDVKDITVVGDPQQLVLVPPLGTTDVSWVIGVSENLDTSMVYSVPVTIFGDHHERFSTEFRVRSGFPQFEKEFFIDFKSQQQPTRHDVTLNCAPTKKVYFEGEIPEIECALKNNEPLPLTGASLCMQNSCSALWLDGEKTKRETLTMLPQHLGYIRTAILLEQDELLAKEAVAFQYLDVPNATLTFEKQQSSVGYDDRERVAFTLNSNSMQRPQNVTVQLTSPAGTKSWALKELRQPQEFQLDIYGNTLKKGKNTLSLSVIYHDQRNNSYHETQNITLTLQPLSFSQHIRYYALRLQNIISKII